MPDSNSPLRKFLEDGEQRFDDLEKRLNTVESKTKNRSISFAGSPTRDDHKFSFVNLIRGVTTGRWHGAEFEKEECEKAEAEARKRDLSYGTASAGGYIVPEQYVAQLIDTLNAKSVVLASGATQMSGLATTPVIIPKKTGNATTYYKAENAAITESQPTFDEIALTPKHLTALVVMSNEVVQFSNPSIEKIVRDDLATQLALRADSEALEGDGLSNNPAGVSSLASAGSVAFGGAPTVDKLYDMLYALELANADMESVGWVMHPRDFNSIRKLKDGNNNYLLQPAISQGAPSTLLGFPVRLSTQVAIDGGTSGEDSIIYFANWRELLWGTWGTLEIAASREAEDYWKNNQTGVRAIMHHDVAARHDESFVLGDGVTA